MNNCRDYCCCSTDNGSYQSRITHHTHTQQQEDGHHRNDIGEETDYMMRWQCDSNIDEPDALHELRKDSVNGKRMNQGNDPGKKQDQTYDSSYP